MLRYIADVIAANLLGNYKIIDVFLKAPHYLKPKIFRNKIKIIFLKVDSI